MATGHRRRKPRPFTNLVGQPPFGRWTVIEHLGWDARLRSRVYRCRCECGQEATVMVRSLTRGISRGCRSCGHWDHGAASRKHPRSAEYGIWLAMKSRCYSGLPNTRRNYQDRGIRVCACWRESFEAFLEDMGPRPSASHSIDRRDNDGNYSCGHCPECLAEGWPANCRWATPAEQSWNRRTTRLLTARGQTMPITHWARALGLHPTTLLYRLAAGMSEEEAIATPRRGGRRPRRDAE